MEEADAQLLLAVFRPAWRDALVGREVVVAGDDGLGLHGREEVIAQ
jgi:hypothetical protein